ncbi:unnamed protein product [Closterium sp. NIES-64]|nr:unnamed protein product [Closterium sp. NIES-64]
MLAAFLAALVFFHSSEFLLALWSTGKPDVRCASLRLASHCSRYVPNTMFPFPRLNSAFLLALWSTGKPHARSLPPPIFVSQEELPFTTLQCLSPPPYIPPLSSLIFFFSPHHPPAQPHPAPFPFPRPAPFCGSWRSCGGTPAGGAAASAGDLFKVRFPPPTPPPLPSLSTTSSAACGPWRGHAAFLFSREYLLAMAAALTEYALETTLFPAFKRRLWPVAWVGGGRCCWRGKRCARQPCGTQARWVRHPGYTGWFMWSIATQLLLVNPLCTLAFALVSWRFFAARIPYEDLYLHPFFGLDYEEFYLHQFFGLDYYEFYLHQVFCLRCEEFYMHQVFGHDYEEFYLHQFLSLKNARYAASVPRCLGAWVSYRASPNGLPSPHPCSYEEFYLHQFFGLEYA